MFTQAEEKLFEEMYQVKEYWSNQASEKSSSKVNDKIASAIWGTVMSFMTLLDGDKKVTSLSFHEKFCEYAGTRNYMKNLKSEIETINKEFLEYENNIIIKLEEKNDMTYIVDKTETLYYGEPFGERMIDRLNDAVSKDFDGGFIDCICPGRWVVSK